MLNHINFRININDRQALTIKKFGFCCGCWVVDESKNGWVDLAEKSKPDESCRWLALFDGMMSLPIDAMVSPNEDKVLANSQMGRYIGEAFIKAEQLCGCAWCRYGAFIDEKMAEYLGVPHREVVLARMAAESVMRKPGEAASAAHTWRYPGILVETRRRAEV